MDDRSLSQDYDHACRESLFVFDGIGSLPHSGYTAYWLSKMVRKITLEELQTQAQYAQASEILHMAEQYDGNVSRMILQKAYERMQRMLRQEARGARGAEGASTAAGVTLLSDGSLHGVCVGDSAWCLLRRNETRQRYTVANYCVLQSRRTPRPFRSEVCQI